MAHSVRLLGSARTYFIANVLTACIPFLLLPVLTRVLTPSDYGKVAMFGILLSMCNSVIGLSVHGAVAVRFFQCDSKTLGEFIGACFALLVSTTILGLIVVLVLGDFLASLVELPDHWMYFAIILSFFQFAINITLTVFQCSAQTFRYGVLQVGQSIFNALISLLLVLLIELGWEGRILGQGVAICVFGMLAMYWLKKNGLLRVSAKSRVHVFDAISFGLPLIPHAWGTILLAAVDRLVIVKFLGLDSVGIYLVALQISQMIGFLTDAFNKAFAPWLMAHLSQPDPDMSRRIVLLTYLYMGFLLAIGVVFGLAAPLFLSIFAGSDFNEAGKVVPYLSLGFVFGGYYYMVTNYLFYRKKTHILALITISIGIVHLIILIPLTKFGGMVGSATAFAFTQFATFVVTWIVANRVQPMPWRRALSNLSWSELRGIIRLREI